MRRFFEHDGKRFLYDYSTLSGERVIVARRLAELHFERVKNPPRSVRELKMTGDHLWEADVFGYLLTEVDENGKPVEWNRDTSPDEAREFYLKLPADVFEQLEYCRADFFVKARILRPDAAERLQNMFNAIKGMSSDTKDPESEEPALPETPNESLDSTTPESEDEG